jgi:hypothetical protein
LESNPAQSEDFLDQGRSNMQRSISTRGSTPKITRQCIIAAMTVVIFLVTACESTTSRLTPADEQRFAAEGIVRRADDIRFRYTHDVGRRDTRWEDRRASIIVTPQSVLIHKNEKIGLEITPRTRRFVEVTRDREHVRIRVGSGQSREVWSFQPSSDAAGWAENIRAVARASRSSANR